MTSSATRTDDDENRDDKHDKDAIKLHILDVVYGETSQEEGDIMFLRTKFRRVISCPVATRQQVRQVLVVLRQHGERLFPTQKRLEKTGESGYLSESLSICVLYIPVIM